MIRHPQQESTLIVAAEVVGLALGSYLADHMERVRRALPDTVVYAVTLAVTVVYAVVERSERRRGDHRG